MYTFFLGLNVPRSVAIFAGICAAAVVACCAAATAPPPLLLLLDDDALPDEDALDDEAPPPPADELLVDELPHAASASGTSSKDSNLARPRIRGLLQPNDPCAGSGAAVDVRVVRTRRSGESGTRRKL
jgi:hypothetical protein